MLGQWAHNIENQNVWLREQLGQPIERVTPDADFIKDLGMN